MSDYFLNLYDSIRYPAGDETTPGLRNSQLGAAHAVAAHITQRRDPGVVVLPTGAGKTAVLMMAPFLARSARALVLTPSRLVRSQIADDFKSLRTLKKLEVLQLDATTPEVKEIEGRITQPQGWAELQNYDAVIGTPNSLSPEYEDVPNPPENLFDIVLVDEAHHAPARTWSALLRSFEEAHRFLFTATPFRRDDKQIQGRLIYVYSIRQAHKDGIFGDIDFEAVYPGEGESSDIAIAKAAERALREDREAGHEHRLMIRTDQKTRASELKDIYAENTSLRVRSINSGHSLAHAKRVVRLLREGELDGVICVDMLGEGFDFPNLKLAAVHSPHKSLEVTLQFIGRFARTGEQQLGRARFFAAPAEIQAETDKLLYKEGAVWGELVHSLSDVRIERELRIREILERFDEPNTVSEETLEISLGALRPYFHVKVYRVGVEIDVTADVKPPQPLEVRYHQVSSEDQAAVFITREIEQPQWTFLEAFSRIQYDLFIVFFDPSSKLLFINSTRRKSIKLYEAIASAYTNGDHEILPAARVNRVLAGLEHPDFFNVGMKNSVPNNPTESYRIITGPRADDAIQPTDGRSYHRGHVFGKGTIDGVETTIGYSSSSKVWSNRSGQLPDLIAWCEQLAERMDSAGVGFQTGTGLDRLPLGEEVTRLPTEVGQVIAAAWDVPAYRDGTIVQLSDSEQGVWSGLLADLRIEVDRNGVTDTEIPFSLYCDGLSFDGMFTLDTGGFEFAFEIETIELADGTPLAAWLRSHPIDFYFADFTRLRGRELHRASLGAPAYDPEYVRSVEWAGVSIQSEVTAPAGQRSIHDYIRDELAETASGIVIYDHRPGEIADFVELSPGADAGEVALYHAKASSGAEPGGRVDDLHDVCGQVVRSIRWLGDPSRLAERLFRRTANGSSFVRGNRVELRAFFEQMPTLRYRVVLVQPGLSCSSLNEQLLHLLGAADDYLVRSQAQRLEVWGSP